MDVRRYLLGSERAARFSPLLLAVALSPAFLQMTCEPSGDTRLASLELEVFGVNRLVFDSAQRVYDLWLPVGATSVTVRAAPVDPAARVTWYVPAGDGTVEGGNVGVGGGDVTVDVPPDGQSLFVGVFPPGGAVDTYIIAINPVCLEGYPCDDGNECTADQCNPLVQGSCSHTTLPDGTSCGIDRGCNAGACLARSWRTAEPIHEPDLSSSSRPRVAVGPRGNVFAAWKDRRDSLFVTRYTPGQGWSTPEPLEYDDGRAHNPPELAFDLNGNATAVWAQVQQSRSNLWARRYTPSQGWGTPELLEDDDGGNAFSPSLAVDTSGNVSVVWFRNEGTQYEIWERRFSPSLGWGTAVFVEPGEGVQAGSSAAYPKLAIGPDGNATAVWGLDYGRFQDVWANRYTTAEGWGTPFPLENDDSANAGHPNVVVDHNGHVTVVWNQINGSPADVVNTRTNCWANHYSPGEGWGGPVLIEAEDGPAHQPQVVVDPNGNVTVVWAQSDGVQDNIWANRYSPSEGWGTAVLIEDEDLGQALPPKLAVDPHGGVTAVWAQWDDIRWNIWANRYVLNQGWGTATRLESGDSSAFDPHVSVDPNGRVTAVWTQYQGTGVNALVWANRFE